MNTSKFRAATLFSMFVVIISALFFGCGTNPQQDGGDGSTAIGPANATGTLFSTVEDPQFGTYELVAQGENQQSGKWNFLVRATRGGTKGQLRFVWDFGNGPEAEGTQQTYSFTSSGTYVIKVSALQADNSVAFVLTLTIEVLVDPNQGPVAVAGADQAVYENDLVFLYGGDSTDPNGDPITYAWAQTFGPTVGILHAADPSASFVAPLVDADTDLVFRLTVSDGELVGRDDAIVHVKKLLDPAGIDLQANAGADQQVGPGTTVTLSGSAAPADSATTFVWTQVQGPSVTLSGADRATATFVTPAVASGSSATLIFEFVATLQNASAVDEANVTVIADAPPTGGGGGGTDPCTVDTDRDGRYDCVAGCPATSCDQCPNDPRKGAPQQCGCGVPDTDSNGNGTADCLETQDCVTITTSWTASSFLPQSSVFTAQFDATPSVSSMDGVIGLSQGAGLTFNSFAALVRFNPSGTIDVRNGGAYGADTSVPYIAGQRFHFRLVVNVPARTYDIYATPQGSAEVRLGSGYAFRTEQNTVTSLDNWGAWADVGTAVQVCGFAISGASGAVLSANAGADVTIATGGSTPLSGSATGGAPPYTYSWSPSTNLSPSATIPNPTANPAVTTTYTLTVKDSLNATANDTVTVTVQAASALVANAGPDRQIAPGGSVVLSGSATGGTAPYTYSWSPTTGIVGSATVQSPTVSSSATTTYTLTVRDNQSRTAGDSAMVTVTTATIGNTYYVATNATNASDANPGTEASPWKTLTKSGNTARAGDTVYVKAGMYTETLQPLNSGVAGSLITFKAYPGQECQGAFGGTKSNCQVIIDGQVTRGTGADFSRPNKYVRLEGFEIRNHTDSGVYFQAWGDRGVEGVEVANNYIHNNISDGVWARNSIKSLVENNDIYANDETAIGIGGLYGSDQLFIRKNQIHYNGKDGIQGTSSNSVFEYNVMYDQFHTDKHQDGFDLLSARNVIIRYNTVFDFTQLIYFPLKDEANLYLDGAQIYGNVLYTNRYWTVNGGEAPGIFIDARRSGAIVRNVDVHSNTVGWCGYGAIWIMDDGLGMGAGQISGIKIRNNIFYQSNVDVSGPSTEVTFDYNALYQSTLSVNAGPNNKYVDPQFVNYSRYQSWDFHLKSTSPAINTGADLGVTFLDIDGQTRPLGGRLDIGAFERQ